MGTTGLGYCELPTKSLETAETFREECDSCWCCLEGTGRRRRITRDGWLTPTPLWANGSSSSALVPSTVGSSWSSRAAAAAAAVATAVKREGSECGC